MGGPVDGTDPGEGLVHAARELLGADVRPLEGDSGEVFLVGVAGEQAVLRLYTRDSSRAAVDAALLALVRGLLPVPRVLEQRGQGTPEAPAFLLLERLPGIRLDQWLGQADAGLRERAGDSVGRILARLAGVPFLRAGRFVDSELRLEPWPSPVSLAERVASSRDQGALAGLSDEDFAGLVEVARGAEDLLETGGGRRVCLVHGCFDPTNVLVDPTTGEITGLLDWELAHAGRLHTDLGALLRFESDPVFGRAVVRAYIRHAPGLFGDADVPQSSGNSRRPGISRSLGITDGDDVTGSHGIHGMTSGMPDDSDLARVSAKVVELARAADLAAVIDLAAQSPDPAGDPTTDAAVDLLQATARCRNLAAGRPTPP